MAKEKNRVVSVVNGVETVEVPAYTGNEKAGTLELAGWNTCTVFADDKAGDKALLEVCKAFPAKVKMLVNRQILTDAKNAIRPAASETEEQLLEKLRKETEKLDALKARLALKKSGK